MSYNPARFSRWKQHFIVDEAEKEKKYDRNR